MFVGLVFIPKRLSASIVEQRKPAAWMELAESRVLELGLSRIPQASYGLRGLRCHTYTFVILFWGANLQRYAFFSFALASFALASFVSASFLGPSGVFV